MKKAKLAKFIYVILCNLPVSSALCLTGSILGVSSIVNGALIIDFSNINWLYFLYNFLTAYTIANLVGMFIPLAKIGKWFASLFKVDTTSYTGHMPYRLLSIFMITVIFWCFISPSLTILNILLNVTDVGNGFLAMLYNIPIYWFVGWLTSLAGDAFATFIARKIYPEF